MKQFIKLNSVLLNTKYIYKIELFKDGEIPRVKKYAIHMIHTIINGGLFMGSGFVESKKEILYICSDLNPKDFEILSKWIDS
jgi:hypothetical protein